VPLKKMLRAVCDRLDHHLLLPTGNPLIEVVREGAGYTVRAQGKTYVFPEEDVIQLPIPNTTVERLAEWIGAELEALLAEQRARGLRRLEVEVEEIFGQSARCRRDLVAG
jgi:6-pyruvoyltetrahydropterin/6-carboxytetrahydropterin synthase